MSKLPIEIRDVSPGPDYTRYTGTNSSGLPDGVHTGGVWISPDHKEYWKPLDGRPWMGAEHHLPTLEAECLELMAGQPGFPLNWRIEEAGSVKVGRVEYTRRWLVRQKAWIIPDDYPASSLDLEQVLGLEQGIRRLNELGWSICDSLKVAIDQRSRLFIIDLSCAGPEKNADDEWSFLAWLERLGFNKLARLRQAGRHLSSAVLFAKEHGWKYRHAHVYASRNRPVSRLWATIPDALLLDADYPKTEVWSWVISPELLSPLLVRRYELTWAWSPLNRKE